MTVWIHIRPLLDKYNGTSFAVLIKMDSENQIDDLVAEDFDTLRRALREINVPEEVAAEILKTTDERRAYAIDPIETTEAQIEAFIQVLRK